MASMLTTRNLSYIFPNGNTLNFPDLVCQQGEHWLILGQSGSGKTTLLNLLAGLRTPSSGSVYLNNTDYSQLSIAKLDKFRGKNIGIIFQQPHFVKALDVASNLALAQQLGQQKIDKALINNILTKLQLQHKIHQKTYRLSVGEQQRVAIARAIIHQPLLILADEPTSALDDQNTETVIQLLKEQAEAAKAILMIVTHDNRLKTQFEKRIEL